MATGELSALDGWCTSQLKIVLLGGRNSGKNSVGNFILGKEEFVTRERTSCSRRLGVVAGRWLTVVDTPGWWCDFSARDTSELVKREIISSVSLCSPGPHVFLITVKASSAFSERRRRAVEEHVALLGEKVWSHCMVVFTSADRFEHSGAEECLERGGKALRWLSDKCGQRCHSVILSDGADVTELLGKIQNLVTENGNRVFEMQENILQATAEEKRRVEERAQLRFIRMKQQRSLMRERLRPVTDIRIVLLGAKGSGKTSALNTILGRESSQQASRTAQCLVGKGVVFGRQVTVVDTPGWWMNYFCAESAVFDRREMVLGLSLCPPGPHVFLLVIRMDRAFTETYRRSVEEHLEMISERIWSRVLLLFSFGDWLGGTTTEQYIESEEPLRWLVERCNNRYHVLNSKTKGDGFQVRELIGKIEEMMMAGCSSGWHYEIERTVLQQLESRMRQEEERARDRLMRKEMQRQMAKSQLEKLNPLQELRVVLIGGRKTGKSSCGNTILNQKSFDTDVQTTSCAEKQGKIGGKTVSVLDTPGCFSVTSDLLTASCAILLVVNVSASFKDEHRKALEEQLEAGGGRVWRRTMVLFSYGDWLGIDTSIEQRIESEGEPLQRLVEKCGNRYHVLDNKQWRDGAQVKELMELMEEMMVGERLDETLFRDFVYHVLDNKQWRDGAQVKELMELMEEMMVGERLDVLQGGAPMWKRVSSARDAVILSKKDIKELIKRRHQLSHGLPESATSTPNCSDAAQMVALPGGKARRRIGFTIVDVSYIASVLSSAQGLRWPTGTLPVGLCAPHLGLNSLMHPRNQTMLLVSSQTHHKMLAEEDTISVHSLCNPALRERTLRRLSESGGLQMLIDQWGSSSLEELEAFIDSYFEMMWEETMGSCQDAEPDCATAELDAAAWEAAGEEQEKEVLSSIDRKLSKLELLEEIRSDLVELKQSLESSWRAMQELRDKSKQDQDNTC